MFCVDFSGATLVCCPDDAPEISRTPSIGVPSARNDRQMERKEHYARSAVVRGEPTTVFDWWADPARAKLDKELYDAISLEGQWEEEETATSRSVKAEWVERNGRRVTYTFTSTPDRDRLRICSIAREEIRYPDGRVTVADRNGEWRFAVGPSESETLVQEDSTMDLSGEWRRRDFLPGSRGLRKAMHRDGFRRTVSRYVDATEDEPNDRM
jgi:hypothetical protein